MEFSNGSANVASGGNVFNQTSHNLQGGGLGIRETGIIEKLLVGLLNHSLLRLFRRIYIGELPQNGLDDTLALLYCVRRFRDQTFANVNNFFKGLF